MSKVQIRSTRLQAKRSIRYHSETIPSSRHQSRTAGFHVISCRGTDNIPVFERLTIDAPIILGTSLPEQLELANSFRNTVDSATTTDIILTSNSLGGGRAA